jgi:hypothetical protein
MSNPDRQTKTLLFFLVVGVWGLLLSPLFHGQAVKAQPPSERVRWEFEAVPNMAVGNMMQIFNQEGAKGWEAYAVDPQGEWLFKRRLKG